MRIGYVASHWLTSGAYYPTPKTPPAMLSFDWLRGIQDHKKCKFYSKMESPTRLEIHQHQLLALRVGHQTRSHNHWRNFSWALWVTLSVNRTIWSLSGNTEVRYGLSRFVLCVPPVIHRVIFVVSECSIQSEYLNNKQFDGRKLKTDSWVCDNALTAGHYTQNAWRNNRLKREV